MKSESDNEGEPLDLSKRHDQSEPLYQLTPPRVILSHHHPCPPEPFAIRNILRSTKPTNFSSSSSIFENQKILTEIKTDTVKLSGSPPSSLGPILRTRGKERSLLKCSVCSKVFDRPSLLKRHLRVHTGEKPHVCDVCSKGFSTSSSLNTHRRIHSGEKPHQCPTCGKRFTASSNLYYHRMTHNKEKPHKCFTCGKSFPTPGDLKSHQYVHSGTWPFNCPICQRGFSKQTNLRNHILLHSGDKPHTCNTCGKKFALACNLRAHMKIHTEEFVCTGSKCVRCQTEGGQCGNEQSASTFRQGQRCLERLGCSTSSASSSKADFVKEPRSKSLLKPRSDTVTPPYLDFGESEIPALRSSDHLHPPSTTGSILEMTKNHAGDLTNLGNSLTPLPFLQQLIAWNCQFVNHQRLLETSFFASQIFGTKEHSVRLPFISPTDTPSEVPLFPLFLTEMSNFCPNLSHKTQ